MKERSGSRSDQVAQGFMQLGVKNIQAWGVHNLSGQPLPLLDLS